MIWLDGPLPSDAPIVLRVVRAGRLDPRDLPEGDYVILTGDAVDVVRAAMHTDELVELATRGDR